MRFVHKPFVDRFTLLLGLIALACDDEDGGRAQNAASGPLYALTTEVFGPSNTDAQSYVILTDTSRSGSALRLDDALEVPGRALGFNEPETARLFIGSDSTPSVTRYNLEGSGELEESGSVSFAPEGVSGLLTYGGQIQFVSPRKAYYFDQATAQVVIWNPEDLTLTGSIELAELVRPATQLAFTAKPLRIGENLITFAAWRTMVSVPSESAVIVVNTRTDEAKIVIDERGGYVRDGVLGADGLIYLATEAYGAAVHRLNPANAPPPCLLRFDPETAEFDANYYVELADLLDGATAGSLIVASDPETVFLRWLDEEAFEIKADTNPRVLGSASAWGWARLELGDEPSSERLEGLPLGPGSIIQHDLGDGAAYVSTFQTDATDIIEITADGPGDVLWSTPGLVYSLAKLR